MNSNIFATRKLGVLTDEYILIMGHCHSLCMQSQTKTIAHEQGASHTSGLPRRMASRKTGMSVKLANIEENRNIQRSSFSSKRGYV